MSNRTRRALITILFAVLLLDLGCSRSTGEFGDLTRIGRGKTDKADEHGFTQIYEHMFSHLRSSPIRLCEIGIFSGGSLRMWTEYFPKATVYGIDIFTLDQLRASLPTYHATDFLPEKPETDRIKTFVADQSNRDQLKQFIDTYGTDFDIVLDDGGHTMEQQQISLGFFFKHVKAGGYYVIEDVHTSLPSLLKGYGGQEDEANTTLTMINSFVRNGRIQSQYIRPEEIEYLNSQIEWGNLFARPNKSGTMSLTAIFQKKGGA